MLTFQLNTSMIGIHSFTSQTNNQSSSSSGGFLSGLRSGVSTISHDLGNDIQNEINGGIQDIAHHFNISDFYSWHLLTACKVRFGLQ